MNAKSTGAPSLLVMLDLIARRPGMYLRGDDSERGSQLEQLETLINGYWLAVHHHQLRDPGVELFAGFPAYLEQKFGWSMSQGPIRAIRNECPSDADAWDTFWRLLWEYRDAAAAAG